VARESVQSLERALALLDQLCRGEQPIGVTEFARKLRLAKSTVHRLLATLERAGLLVRTPDAKYRLGLRLWEMGCAAIRELNVRETARPVMEMLASRTGETVHLSIWDGGEAIYIDRVDGTNPIRLHSTIGGRAPAHATASGLTLLAFQEAATQSRVLRGPRKRFTQHTITTPGGLQRKLEEIRRKGCAVSVGGWYPGSAGVAAPIRSHTGNVVAALSVGGPAERIVGRAPELEVAVRTAAKEISCALGDPTTQGSLSALTARRRIAPGIG
jgi:IclR family KDG regulon transcriptional repressor